MRSQKFLSEEWEIVDLRVTFAVRTKQTHIKNFFILLIPI